MEEKGKRPPININDLQKASQAKAEKGSLDYVGDTKEPRQKKGFGSLSQILLPVAIALVLAVMVMYMYSADRGSVVNLDQKVDGVQGGISSLAGTVESISSQVNTIVNTQGEYAKKTEVGSMVQTQIQAQMGGYATEASFDGAVSTINQRLAVLEAEESGSINGTSDEIEVSVLYSNYFRVDPEDWYDPYGLYIPVEEGAILRVKNNSNFDIKNVQLVLVLRTSDRVSLVGCEAEGYPLMWNRVYSGKKIVVFVSSGIPGLKGLEIRAGDDVDIYTTLVIGVSVPPLEPVDFYVEAELENYEVL